MQIDMGNSEYKEEGHAKKNGSLIGLGLGLMGMFLLLQPQVASSADKAIFVIDWVPGGKHIPFYVAVDKGYYEKAGLDVKVVRGFGSADVAKRLALKGGPDFGLSDTPSVIIARTKGAMIKLVGIYAEKGLNKAFVLKGSGIKTPKDLEGRTVGDAVGGASITIFPAFAAVNDIKSWKFVPMRPAAKNPSLIAGKVDAVLTMIHMTPILEKRAQEVGKDIHAIKFSDHGLDLYAHGFAARDETTKKRPEYVRRFMKATLQAIAWSSEFPEKAAEIYLKKFPSQSRYMAVRVFDVHSDYVITPYTKKHGIGRINRDKMKRTLNLIAKYYKVKTPTLDEIYTNEFLPRIFPKRTKSKASQ